MNVLVDLDDSINGESTEEENLQTSSDTTNGDEQDNSLLSMYDPRTWDNLDNCKRDILIEKGMRENWVWSSLRMLMVGIFYAYYSRKLANCEVIDIKWLIYSKELDKVYCFYCKLFKSNQSKCSLLASDGLRDWKRLSLRLKEHEKGVEHFKNMNPWNKLRLRLRNKQTIDDDTQREISKEKRTLEMGIAKNSFSS
jgi:hypothetical protein